MEHTDLYEIVNRIEGYKDNPEFEVRFFIAESCGYRLEVKYIGEKCNDELYVLADHLKYSHKYRIEQANRQDDGSWRVFVSKYNETEESEVECSENENN